MHGKAQYSCLPNENGGIVDDLLVYCIEENKVYMLVINASNIEKDWNWIQKHNTKNVEMHNISDDTCLLAIQGPNATKILQPLTDMDILNLKYYTFVKGKFDDVDNVLVSATGYTGAGGVEIYFKNDGDNAEKIWNKIFEVGTPQGLKPIGLAARDTLRLEMGYCFMEMILTTPHHHLKQDWGGSLNSQKILQRKKLYKSKNRKALKESL